MKKPNITEGEWYHTEDGVFTNKRERLPVAEWTLEADGKAISAVPEMIDALIEAFKAMKSLPDDALGIKAIPDERGEPEPQPIKWELMYEIKEALKKAGCEL